MEVKKSTKKKTRKNIDSQFESLFMLNTSNKVERMINKAKIQFFLQFDLI